MELSALTCETCRVVFGLGFGFQGFRVWGLGFGVQGLRVSGCQVRVSRVWRLACKVQGLGFMLKVWDSGFTIRTSHE